MIVSKGYINFSLSILLLLITCFSVHSQVYNKEVKAKIIVERTSEFFTFKARASNLTNSDFNLRYDFMVFRKDDNGNVSKSSQGNRFFLKANEITVLSTTTINYNEESEVIIALLIYDDEDRPIGQDRIELPKGVKSGITLEKEDENTTQNADQAKPQDGFVLGGFIFNKTITKAGRDFHRYFFNIFNNAEIDTKRNITIEEVPGRGRSTRVSVLVENRLVWQFFSQARKEFLTQMAKETFRRVVRELNRLERQKNEITRY